MKPKYLLIGGIVGVGLYLLVKKDDNNSQNNNTYKERTINIQSNSNILPIKIQWKYLNDESVDIIYNYNAGGGRKTLTKANPNLNINNYLEVNLYRVNNTSHKDYGKYVARTSSGWSLER